MCCCFLLSPQSLSICVRGLRQHPGSRGRPPPACSAASTLLLLLLGGHPSVSAAVWGCRWLAPCQGGDGTVLLWGRRSWGGAPAFGCLTLERDKQPCVPRALFQQAGASVAPLSGASAASRLLGGGINPRVGEVLEQGHVHVGLWGTPVRSQL